MSPSRLLLTVLVIVFATRASVMLALTTLCPRGIDMWLESLLDATLLTFLVAPLIWWTIARPLRREAVAEHAKAESIVGAAAEGIITLTNRAGSRCSTGLPREFLAIVRRRWWARTLRCWYRTD